MEKEPLQVDFHPDEAQTPAGGGDVLWLVIGAAAAALAVAVFIPLIPFLLPVLAVAAALAALSTWRAAKRAEVWRRLGGPRRRVGVRSFLGYTAAWFVGLLVLVPLVFLGTIAAAAALVVLGVVAAVALLAGLFRLD